MSFCAYFFIGYALWLCFAASVFRVGVHSIWCALLALHQTLTSVPERKVKKKISLRGFLCVRPSGASPHPRVGPLEGSQRRSVGGERCSSTEVYFGLTSLLLQIRGQYQKKVTGSENSENRIEDTQSCPATQFFSTNN